jgi:hypothetical protein
MAKFTFQFETDEYTEYKKATYGFDAVGLLNEVAQALDELHINREMPRELYADIGKITAKIDNFLNTLE